jgi:hypothetical protein
MRMAIVAVATLFTVVACTESARAPQSSPPTTLGSGASDGLSSPGSRPAVRMVAENQGDLHLWVSNQSFEDDPVFVTISIDGTEVVAQPFDVEGQHNWILFPLRVPAGQHVLTAASDAGVETEQRFTIPETGRRYAVLEYWNYDNDKGRHFTWRIQASSVAFD